MERGQKIAQSPAVSLTALADNRSDELLTSPVAVVVVVVVVDDDDVF